MKRTSLTVVLLLSVICAFGQKTAVKEAKAEANKYENPDLQKARSLISGALENPETKYNAETWFVAGSIESKIYDNDYAKKQLRQPITDEGAMYDALVTSYDYYLKTIALDTLPNEKGKVKPRYVKNIKKTLKSNIDGYANAGVYYFNQREFKKAYDVWGIYLEIPQLPIMEAGEDGLPADSTIAILEYNRALAALNTQDTQLAIFALNEAKGNGYNQNDVYKFLVSQYEQTRDTVNLIATLKEGEDLFRNEMVEQYDEMGNPVLDAAGNPVLQKENTYTLKLINLYIFSDQYDEAIATLDKVLVDNPDNAEYWNVKGNLYESKKEFEKSIESFEKALQLKPDYADALGNIGRLYFNQAVQKNQEANTTTNNAEYTKIRENEVLPLFRKALPYYEKAYKLDPNNGEYKYALINIFYNLDDPRTEAIENGTYMPE